MQRSFPNPGHTSCNYSELFGYAQFFSFQRFPKHFYNLNLGYISPLPHPALNCSNLWGKLWQLLNNAQTYCTQREHRRLPGSQLSFILCGKRHRSREQNQEIAGSTTVVRMNVLFLESQRNKTLSPGACIQPSNPSGARLRRERIGQKDVSARQPRRVALHKISWLLRI